MSFRLLCPVSSSVVSSFISPLCPRFSPLFRLFSLLPSLRLPLSLGCDIHSHAPALKGSTKFMLYPFVRRTSSTNWLGHGHGYEWHSSFMLSSLLSLFFPSQDDRAWVLFERNPIYQHYALSLYALTVLDYDKSSVILHQRFTLSTLK